MLLEVWKMQEKVSKERKTPEEMEEEKKTKKPFDYKKFYKADGGLMNMSFEEWLKGKSRWWKNWIKRRRWFRGF
jgi:hypothetical protein